jgi:hypothetical protein
VAPTKRGIRPVRHGAGNFGCTPLGGTMSKREPQIGGLKLWAIMFLCPSERSDEAARGLTIWAADRGRGFKRVAIK